MTRWFRRHMRQVFLEDYAQAERALQQGSDAIKTLRGQLYTLYEEVELAIRALDVLGERVSAAKQRVQQRLTQTPTRAPKVFTLDERQREENDGSGQEDGRRQPQGHPE